MNPLTVFWFRRDLRLNDNHALQLALASGAPVLPIFIFDDVILRGLPRRDARVEFIRAALEKLNGELRERGSGLKVFQGEPLKVWPRILKSFKIHAIFCNEDYEPYAVGRDKAVAKLAADCGVKLHLVKDQVIWAKDEVVKDNGEPYRVFTAFSKAWLKKLSPQQLQPFTSKQTLHNLFTIEPSEVPSLRKLGFKPSEMEVPGADISQKLIRAYASDRDRLDHDATSRIGPHLRFGTTSIRKVAAAAKAFSGIYLKELIWREFFMQMLYHFPQTVNQPFDSRYKNIKWRNNAAEFERWKNGETGYPLVDAGMRELNQTGFMHNRARMVTASFLTKHLFMDWRKGERYFAEKLLDFELASNVGNWQWVAGCGCDAAPYFRVFNPELQAKKFDPDGQYVKKWVAEFGTSKYPKPMIDHEAARRRALIQFSAALRRKA